eukprot:364189-Chlamydomonas_euryale.AAC.21
MRLRGAATTVFRARVSGSCAGVPPPPMTCGGGAATVTYQPQQCVPRKTDIAEADSHVIGRRHLASVHGRNVWMVGCSLGVACNVACIARQLRCAVTGYSPTLLQCSFTWPEELVLATPVTFNAMHAARRNAVRERPHRRHCRAMAGRSQWTMHPARSTS